MANYEATKYDFDGANLTGIQGVNTGIIMPWTDSTLPEGFLECDGSDVSRTTYADLFAVVGTTYGSGDGSTTFGLPDLADKCCQNESPTKTFATSGGAETTPTTGNISVSIGNTSISGPTLASHSHPSNMKRLTLRGRSEPFWTTGNPQTTPNAGGSGAHSHPSGGTFSGNANSVLQPYITLVYIIKT